MIKVSVGTNFETKDIIVETSKTLRTVLEEQGINYSNTIVFCGANPVAHAELDKTFAELGIETDCRLTCTTSAKGGL